MSSWGRVSAATLAMVVLGGAAVWLGTWQYGAWQAHRQEVTDSLTDKPPVALTGLMGADDPFPGNETGQPVEVGGTWAPEATFFVSGRRRVSAAGERTDGFWVVTPLLVAPTRGAGEAAAAALPVVRGWVADPADAPAPPEGAAEVTGWLQPPEGDAPEVDRDPTDDVFSALRVADLVQRMDRDAFGAYIVLGERPGWRAAVNAGKAGLQPAALEERPEPGRFLAIRNLFYAAEWWFFAGFVVFVWARFCRDEFAGPEVGPEGGAEVGPEVDAAAAPGGAAAAAEDSLPVEGP